MRNQARVHMAGGHGGKREGAGRKPGKTGKLRSLRAEARAKMAQLVASSSDPLQFVCELACDPEQEVALRLQAATVALPFLHPKLSAMASVSATVPKGVDPSVLLDQVMGRIARLAGPVIEGEKSVETDTVSAGHEENTHA